MLIDHCCCRSCCRCEECPGSNRLLTKNNSISAAAVLSTSVLVGIDACHERDEAVEQTERGEV